MYYKAAMESIFTYTNYRCFLKDYLKAKKLEKKGFSLKVIADRAGFKARDYILRVMNGSRNLSQSGICMLSRALRLTEKEADYFVNLVGFNQARNPGEAEIFYTKLAHIHKYGQYQKLRQDQFEYLSEWYYSAIRSLLPLLDFKDNYAMLGRLLDPPLTPGQVKTAVTLLLNLGLIQRSESGKYTASDTSLSTGDEVVSVALMQFHKQSLDLARRALDRYSSFERDVSGVTMSLSSLGFEQIKKEIQSFRKRIMEIASRDTNEERAFQLNIQLFPLSKRNKKS
jgi:uncharacterized protein (TIGR02147 family)